ncbi:hypothetical protein CLF_100354 [Clonorchis sinensis]|uniref:Uncharacterized protein n=1 Tax=Clonorchis sinensis TaxID=79923 RepID=G7Y395_CLOSI|nr:hypothetical protein CLF_100354 [Clonorchis sinensis]
MHRGVKSRCAGPILSLSAWSAVASRVIPKVAPTLERPPGRSYSASDQVDLSRRRLPNSFNRACGLNASFHPPDTARANNHSSWIWSSSTKDNSLTDFSGMRIFLEKAKLVPASVENLYRTIVRKLHEADAMFAPKRNSTQSGEPEASANSLVMHDENEPEDITRIDAKTDLGIWLPSNMFSSLHYEKLAEKAFAVLQMIRRTFSRITRPHFQILYGPTSDLPLKVPTKLSAQDAKKTQLYSSGHDWTIANPPYSAVQIPDSLMFGNPLIGLFVVWNSNILSDLASLDHETSARVSENIDKIVNHRASNVELQHPLSIYPDRTRMNGAIAKLKTGWGKFQKFFRYKHFTHKKSLDSIELSKLKQLTTRCSPYSHLPVEYEPDSTDFSENLTGMGNQNRLIQGLSFKRLKYSPWTTVSESVPTFKTGRPRLKVSLGKSRKCGKKAEFDQAQLVKCVEIMKTGGKEKVGQPRLRYVKSGPDHDVFLNPDVEQNGIHVRMSRWGLVMCDAGVSSQLVTSRTIHADRCLKSQLTTVKVYKLTQNKSGKRYKRVGFRINEFYPC